MCVFSALGIAGAECGSLAPSALENGKVLASLFWRRGTGVAHGSREPGRRFCELLKAPLLRLGCDE